MVEFAGHLFVAAILGFMGLWLEDVGVHGLALLVPVLVPAASVGFLVGRSDFGFHAASAQWIWAPAVAGLGLAWALSGFDDGYWNVFISGYCGDFKCMGNVLVTAPALATIGYSVGARTGSWRRAAPARQASFTS